MDNADLSTNGVTYRVEFGNHNGGVGWSCRLCLIVVHYDSEEGKKQEEENRKR